eukprot:Rmarinus@m.3962
MITILLRRHRAQPPGPLKVFLKRPHRHKHMFWICGRLHPASYEIPMKCKFFFVGCRHVCSRVLSFHSACLLTASCSTSHLRKMSGRTAQVHLQCFVEALTLPLLPHAPRPLSLSLQSPTA